MTASHWVVLVMSAGLFGAATGRADIPADGDGDGDVDFADYGLLADCLSGPDIPAFADCQALHDLDFDADVDLADAAAFQKCFSGEDQPADPECVSHQARLEDGCLHLIGTAADTQMVLRLRLGLPQLLEVDIGLDGVVDFQVARGQFDCIVIDARGGDDVLWIDEQYGAFTDLERTWINGGFGNDTLLGGSGGETFEGGPGDDTLYLGPGPDLCVWNPGDGNDLVEGGDGADEVQVHGEDEGATFALTANGTRVRFDRLAPAPYFLDMNACESFVLEANGGNDTFTCTGNLAPLVQIYADGGPGADTLLGSNGADLLIGGDGDDFIDGQQGNDFTFLGAGDDVFQWDPGDGSEVIAGQAGHDTIIFNGSSANETYDASASGARLRFTRDIGNIVLDADGIEQFDLRALSGSDTVVLHDLAGTDVTQVNVDLAGTPGGGTGDGAVDVVQVHGLAAADVFDVTADGGLVIVDLAADVRVKGYEPSDQLAIAGVGGDVVNVLGSESADTATITANGPQARVDVTGYSVGLGLSGALSLVVSGLGGPDAMSCTGNLAGLLIPITLDGGAGADTLLGSNGTDVLVGGPDGDFVDGQQGNDFAYLGDGDDTFQWDPGDGSDILEGQAGHDTLVFNGSAANEIYDASASGPRLRFTRNIGNIVMDADGIEQLDLRALGGADSLTVNDLAGTAVSQVNVDLAGTQGGGSGDAQPDAITVNGTAAPDTIHVAANSGAVEVLGLSAEVRIEHSEPANDLLTVNGLGVADTLTADPGVTALIQLILNP